MRLQLRLLPHQYVPGRVLELKFSQRQTIVVSLICGAVMGLLAGITGIGGGVFLVPMILVLGLGSMKQAAACGVVFIWLNSMAGLASRSQYHFVDFSEYLPLIGAKIATVAKQS